MTVEKLQSFSVKELGQMAKKQGVLGWHSMRKEQLVSALAELGRSRRPARAAAPPPRAVAVAAPSRRRGAAPAASSGRSRPAARRGAVAPATPAAPAKPAPTASAKPTTAAQEAINRNLGRMKEDIARNKDLAFSSTRSEGARDRMWVMVRDPYWLHACWELSRLGVKRAEAALAQEWHTAKPVLRVFEVSNHGSTVASETLVRTVNIHGGVTNWYIDVVEPPKTYRVDIGYLAPSGKFHMLARSNVVNTPRPGTVESVDQNWNDVAQHSERIYAMNGGYTPEGPGAELRELFEERLRRPMHSPLTRSLAFTPAGHRKREFGFTVDAELIIHGSTDPDARVTLQGDPVQLKPDGTFTVRFNMPDCRQIIPAVACSADGVEQRTIVVAVERNTKIMEPLIRENDDD